MQKGYTNKWRLDNGNIIDENNNILYFKQQNIFDDNFNLIVENGTYEMTNKFKYKNENFLL